MHISWQLGTLHLGMVYNNAHISINFTYGSILYVYRVSFFHFDIRMGPVFILFIFVTNQNVQRLISMYIENRKYVRINALDNRSEKSNILYISKCQMIALLCSIHSDGIIPSYVNLKGTANQSLYNLRFHSQYQSLSVSEKGHWSSHFNGFRYLLSELFGKHNSCWSEMIAIYTSGIRAILTLWRTSTLVDFKPWQNFGQDTYWDIETAFSKQAKSFQIFASWLV